MTPKFVYVDHKTGETFVATDLKAIARKTGKSYESLVYRLRDSNLYIHQYVYTLSRVTESLPSLRNPSQYRINKNPFKLH
jgi:hypothetical protein